MRVTAAVHRFINYVKQYEKCDPAAGEIPLSVPLLAGNCEPDNLSRYKVICIAIFGKIWRREDSALFAFPTIEGIVVAQWRLPD